MGANTAEEELRIMRLLIGILFAMALGILALGAMFEALQESAQPGRKWPITRPSR